MLTGSDGPHQNVLKLRPPLVLKENDADVFMAALDDIHEDAMGRAELAERPLVD